MSQSIRSNGLQRRIFAKNLWLDGSPSVTDMVVDGSSVAKTFILAPAAGEIMRVSRIIFYVRDAGNFDANAWGNAVTLTNGQRLKTKLNSSVEDLLDMAVKTTGHVAGICYDTNVLAVGVGDQIMHARFTFSKFGQFLRLRGDESDELQWVINDNMAGLNAQRIMAQGYYENQTW